MDNNKYMESLKSIFLSKKNIANVHLQILAKLNLRNLPSEQRKIALNLLIQTMKKYYMTLQFEKINQSNLHKVLIQYNQLCYQKALIPISNHFRINLIDQLNTNFNDRPISSNNDIDNKKFNKVQFEQRNSQQTDSDLSLLMSERKSLYHQNNDRPTTPDFLKAQKVGKTIENDRPKTPEILKGKQTSTSTSTSKSTSNSNNFNSNNFEGSEEDSETFADFDNYPTTITNDDNFVEDDMSFEDRLKQIEREREQTVLPQVNNDDVNKLKDTFKETFKETNKESNMKDKIKENLVKIKRDEIRIINKKKLDSKKDFLINTESFDIVKNKFTFDFGMILRSVRVLILDQMEFDIIVPNINDEEFRYMIDEKERNIKIEKGYYTITKLINRLNKNNDIIFRIDKNRIIIEPRDNKDFKLLSSNIGDILGLGNNYDEEGMIEGDFPYKLKNNRYIKLHLDNINNDYYIIDIDNAEKIKINLNNINLDELQIRLTDMNDNLLEILRGDLKILLSLEYDLSINEDLPIRELE